MTDEQIMQRLEYKRGEIGVQVCIDHDLLDETINLINRREAVIKRLKTNIDGLNIFTTNYIKVIRLQAIKEFAERLKETAYSYSDISGYRSTVVDADSIDNLVKEMMEVERQCK